MKSVVADRDGVRLGGRSRRSRRRSPRPSIYEMHVRGFTRHPSSGVAPGNARHLRRPRREDSLPARSRRHGRRAAAGVPVRSARTRRRAVVNYWGYQPVSFFAPHHGYSSRAGAARRARRVPRHGQGAAPRRHRGDPRRRVQPHGRRRRGRTDASATAASRTTSTTSSRTDKSRYADYTGCGNTLNANQPIVRRLIRDSLRYWVDRDARGRLPLRSRVDPLARRDGQPAAQPAGPVGHRVGSAARRHEADRRGLGRRRASIRSAASSATRGRSGTAGSATTCGASCRGDDGHGVGARVAAARQPGHLRPRRSARPSRASTSSPATTASR